MLYNCDELLHVMCSHPEDSPRLYTFGIRFSDFDSDISIRKAVEMKVNEYGYWHDIEIWSEYFINGKLYKKSY